MKKTLLILALLLATPASADALTDRVVSMLREDGFQEIRVSRTWLGRLRFVATGQGTEREIVINPATGVVLRDYTRDFDDDGDNGGGGSAGGGAGAGTGSSGSGDGPEDDDDDDRDDDDDDDDDSDSDSDSGDDGGDGGGDDGGDDDD